MRTGHVVLVTTLLVLGCAAQRNGAATPPAVNVERELAGIEETRAAFTAALKANRPQDLRGLFTADFRAVGPGAPDWELMRRLGASRGTPFPYDSIAIRPIETVVVNDSIAWDFGTSSVYFTNEQGEVQELHDSFLAILKKGDDGVWRLHREVATAGPASGGVSERP